MSRALVTGGAGGIGLHLVRRLVADGHRVDILDDFSRGRRDAALAALVDGGRVEVIEMDLAAPGTASALRRDYRQVYHLAAVVGVARVVSRPFSVLRGDTAATVAAIELARRQEALERFVFTSSGEVHDRSVGRGLLPVPTPPSTELLAPDPAHPRSSYALAKLYGEALCFQSDLPWTVTRIHNAYGPRMGTEHVIPELIARAHAAADGGELVVRSSEHRRTFCHVGDTVEMLVRAAASNRCAGEVLNVGADGPEVSMAELANVVTDAVGRRLRIVAGPADPGSPERRRPDMTGTEELLAYRARVPLPEGIASTVAWYRDHEPAGA